jgi:hypothetical protein
MLFVAVCKVASGTPKQRIERRAKWHYPENIKMIGEYWLQARDPNVIMIFEAETVAPIMQTLAAWGDLFDINVQPAVTADEGLKLAMNL